MWAGAKGGLLVGGKMRILAGGVRLRVGGVKLRVGGKVGSVKMERLVVGTLVGAKGGPLGAAEVEYPEQ